MTTAEYLLSQLAKTPDDEVLKNACADAFEEEGMTDKSRTIRNGIIARFGVDFDSTGGALTLNPSDIGTHKDGWTITGEIHEDYFEWVNDFEANHPEYGALWGNFEDTVYAISREALEHFMSYHEPSAWDYYDI